MTDLKRLFQSQEVLKKEIKDVKASIKDILDECRLTSATSSLSERTKLLKVRFGNFYRYSRNLAFSADGPLVDGAFYHTVYCKCFRKRKVWPFWPLALRPLFLGSMFWPLSWPQSYSIFVQQFYLLWGEGSNRVCPISEGPKKRDGQFRNTCKEIKITPKDKPNWLPLAANFLQR